MSVPAPSTALPVSSADGSVRRALRSVKGQLLTWLLVSLAIVIAINSFSVYRNATDAANTAYDRSLLVAARVIAERVDLDHGKVVVEVPYIAMDFIETGVRGRVYYRVGGLKGEPVSGYDDLPDLPPGIERSQDYSALVRFYFARYRGETVRVAALHQPVQEGDARGMAMVQVAETLDSREALTRQILLTTLYRQMLLVLMAVLAVLLAVRYALRPLGRLRADLESRRADELSHMDSRSVPSEVRPIVVAMNQYVSRLRALIVAHERFVADASHQLRTPLTLLKTQAELAIRETHQGRLAETLSALHRSVSDAVHLANQLLSRARAENSIAACSFAPLDLIAVARQVCLELAPDAVAKRIDLSFEGAGDVAVNGDATLLHELVENVVDNAIRYTPADGKVVVRVLARDGAADLEVEDSGAGIPAEERERVFEPFARLTSGESQGSGLGLAIVSDIARAHGATIRLLHADHAMGLKFCARFPCLASAPSTL